MAFSSPPPNLRLIPPERWAEVLRPLPHRLRMRAINTSGDVDRAGIIVSQREIEDWERQDVMRETIGTSELEEVLGSDLSPPRSATRVRRVQVNLRLTETERRALGRAASMLGLRPTTLARSLVVRGTQRLMAAARRGEAQSPSSEE